MKTRMIILATIGLMVSTLSSGQKVSNPDYKLEKEIVKISLLPIVNERNEFNDTVMTKIFRDSSEYIQLVTPIETRKIVSSNQKIQELLNKIIATDYKKKELKRFPNLNTILDKSDIAYLKENIENTDLVLIPIEFYFRSMLGHTFAYVKFRFYDLNSGEFIFEFSENINVNLGGEKAIKSFTGILLSSTHSYYIDNFLKKYKLI